MHWLRRIPCWRSLPRRLCAGLTLLAYLATVLGLPLPAPARPKSDEPFPCQDHPCGCRTAEQCWRSCCCFTPEQRLAWAKAHNVTPPPYAEKPAAKGWRTVRLRDREQGKNEPAARCSCCPPQTTPTRPGRPAPASTSRKPCPTSKPCCSTKPSKETSPPSQDRPTNRPGSAPRGGLCWHLGMSAQGCQGASTLWARAGTVLPASPPLAWSPCLVPAGWLSPAADLPAILATAPPDPPPRLPSVCVPVLPC
jgi:hypothetical protein